MKSRVVFEMNIPENALPIPLLKEDGMYELAWELPNGSVVSLTFENGDPVHSMYAKLVAMEETKRQADAPATTAS